MVHPRIILIVLTALPAAIVLLSLTIPVRQARAAPATTRTYPDASPPCNTTLQACINGSVAGDQILIAANTYTESLVLTKAVSLIGAGPDKTILQAPVNQRVLLVSGAGVTNSTQINRLTIRGGRLHSNNGAGILVQSGAQPRLVNVNFVSNTVLAANAAGGGLFSSSSLTLTNVQFISNSASAGNGGGLAGDGAAHLILNNVSFSGNQANNVGGALYANSAVINGSSFSLNVAALQRGGGAYITNTVVITNSTFEGNQARDDGGGVFAGGAVTVSGGLFRANVAVLENAGALYAAGNLIMSGSLITGNQARHGGGGFFAVGSATVNGGTFQFNRSISNSAGALYAIGNLEVNDSVINDNESSSSGGALFTLGVLTLTNSLLAENLSTSSSGGAVRAVGPSAISGTQFISNSAPSAGGAIDTDLDVTLTNSIFMSNTSGSFGGGLRSNGRAVIDGGSFAGNSSFQGGGASVAGVAVVDGTQFSDNVALNRGGGLDVITATVRDAAFHRNQTLVGNGGGLAAANVLSVSASLFMGNRVLSGTAATATGNGGGLFGDGVTTSTNNIFFDNFAFRLGGGADVDLFSGRGDQYRGNLTGPQGSGGGLFVSAPFELDRALFFTNTANTAGGLGVNSGASGRVENSLFARNVVSFTDGGSAMRLLSTTGMTVVHNTIVGVSQPGRAAIHMQSLGDFSIFANIFSQHSRALANLGSVPTSTVTEDYNLFYSVTTLFVGPVISFTHRITADPLFVDPAAGDFHLSVGSPAIDATPSFSVVTDIDGQLRPAGGNFDIGFDEFLPNVAPTADAGPDQSLEAGTPAVLDGSGSSDLEGQALSYHWTQDRGTPVALSDPTAVMPLFTAPAASGLLRFQLVVTDSLGLASAPDLVVITVTNQPISGLAASNNGPTAIGVGVNFSATIGTGTGVSFEWNFGDGSGLGAGATPTHAYATSGLFTAIVTATNDVNIQVASTPVVIMPPRLYLPMIMR